MPDDWNPIVEGFIEASIAIVIGYVLYAVIVALVTGLGFAYNVLAMKIIGAILLVHLATATALLLLVEPRSNRLDTFIEVYTLPVSITSLLIATAILILKHALS